jgi:deoxyxylulose-5-phosphate synthase
LAGQGVNAMVVNIHTIKPLDIPLLVDVASHTGFVVTVEEHQVMVDLVERLPRPLKILPTPMEIIECRLLWGVWYSCRVNAEVWAQLQSIARKVLETLSRKKGNIVNR